jgi:serine/threonine-protein kinase
VSAHAHPPPIIALDSLLGTLLDGKYELKSHIATGGMGAVFKARHVHLRKDVAVKVLRPELSSAPDLVERFRREAEIASALEHDNIVRVTDFGRSEDGLLYLVMEYLAGESLFDRIRRERKVPPPRAVTWLWQVCAGLEAAHQLGVVHRDLKPENVFLARTASGREVVKLLDFGIAKFARAAGEPATQVGIVVGTPEYLSPEQAMGLPVDARADVYTVGIIAFRLLAGHHPFKSDSSRGLLLQQASEPVPPLAEANPELADWPELCAAVAQACAKDPAERPPSAAALGELLAGALGPAFVAPPGATPVGLPAARIREAQPLILPDEPLTAPPPPLGLTPPAGTPPVLPALTPPATPVPTPAATPSVKPVAAPARRRWPWALAAAGALAVAVAGGAGAVAARRAWHERPLAQARALLAQGKAAEALALADRVLPERPGDRTLLRVRARALAKLPGRQPEQLAAYAAAQAAEALEVEDYQALAAMLADRRFAEGAARVLRDAPPMAVPEVAALARTGPTPQRLRALAVLRELGAEETVDRVGIYIGLLADPDCEARKLAAHRLGELGDRSALPALRTAAAAGRSERKFLFSSPTRIPACGAAEAAEAVRKIQAGN